MLKLVKKTVVLSFLCFILFSLVACDSMYFLYEKKDKEVSKIELINYDNPNAKSDPSEKSPLGLDKLEIIETLDSTKNEDFLQELSQVYLHNGGKYKQTLYSHDGVGVRIIYTDDSFELITLTIINDKNYFFVAEYDGTGNQMKSKDVAIQSFVEQFNNLLEEYFTII